jgi:hypothetical protein
MVKEPLKARITNSKGELFIYFLDNLVNPNDVWEYNLIKGYWKYVYTRDTRSSDADQMWKEKMIVTMLWVGDVGSVNILDVFVAIFHVSGRRYFFLLLVLL